jgi:hypothetical protein
MLHRCVREGYSVSIHTPVSKPRFREDSVPRLLDPVVESVRRQVVCTGVWHVGDFGVCGREFTFLVALADRQTDLSHVSKSVPDVLDKDARGRRRTRVFGFDAQFNGVRSDEILRGRVGHSDVRTKIGTVRTGRWIRDAYSRSTDSGA